ncbi:unnamed protein product [Dovyalis caffra]|uniref:Uncharacterized protein n=1 Tax=Dovyalis caffra TaxID=77055 RepID=A0AAV1RA20_9ROSI|nr:unnamed protein product [Dovyalis caffra]
MVVCGFIERGREVFDFISERTLISCNSVIDGVNKSLPYSSVHNGFVAIAVFQMQPVPPATMTPVQEAPSQGLDPAIINSLTIIFVTKNIAIDVIIKNRVFNIS